MTDGVLVLELERQLISSQRFRDDVIIEGKRETGDYTVSYYDLDVGGVPYRVVVDGHHSLDAALADGVRPIFVRVPHAIKSEYDYVVGTSGVDAWLDAHIIDSPWHDPITGEEIW